MNLKIEQYKIYKRKHRKKKNLKNEKCISELWDNLSSSQICVIEIPKGGGRSEK